MANEVRLIDANAYESDIRKMFVSYGDGTYPGDKEAMIYDEALADALYALNDAPTVDAVPVVHGRWEKRKAIVFDDEMIGYRCSVCNTTWDAETNYCPNCGAKMDGGNEDG